MATATKPRQSSRTAHHTPPVNPPPPELEVAKRLVVEVNRRTASDLAWLVAEEELNKTTIVNRAVQIYRMIIEAQRKGGSIVIDDPDKGSERLIIV